MLKKIVVRDLISVSPLNLLGSLSKTKRKGASLYLVQNGLPSYIDATLFHWNSLTMSSVACA